MITSSRATIVIAIAIGACGPAAPGAPALSRGAAAAPAFAELRDRVLAQLLSDAPARARELGLHAYDGAVASASGPALGSQIAALRRAAGELAAIDASRLSPDDALDLAELQIWVERSLFALVDRDEPHTLPQYYGYLFAADTYLDRDYASLEVRARALLDQERASLREVANVRGNLRLPLSKPVAEVAARDYAGYAEYLRGDVARMMGAAGDAAFRAEFARVNGALADAAAELGAWLARQAEVGDDSHVLGPERFAKLLRVQEGLTAPLDELERINERDLAANKAAFDALAPTVTETPVPEADVLPTAARMVREARAFVIDHGIVTLVSDGEVAVRETPPYARWNPASLDAGGPFDPVATAFFQVTIPDASWPSKERQAYLGTEGRLRETAVHEVYPGHFVQAQWARRAPTRVQKAFQSDAFVEGWATYAEMMMVDEGLGADDPANRLAALRLALKKNCRFAAAFGIHAHGMTVEEATRRFETDCYVSPAAAREQALRATFDPGYFAYALGKLEILALRDEAYRALGARFSLRAFHDALLAHGAPPVALIHDRVLHDLEHPR